MNKTVSRTIEKLYKRKKNQHEKKFEMRIYFELKNPDKRK